ncbi:hypothetical protein DSM3645_26464 [Blastopirellula marina DSM 3645]|uniref:Uncharacterized protein n=1 Tax=Blastopirellula marina DSM 3645 TaxID=314230 RepID=A3ZY32_9BACT|nr:hypothetical protein DSM3645_26464 [Blastopirellula marina DSM 3645]
MLEKSNSSSLIVIGEKTSGEQLTREQR